jgi:hypothetical protein
MVIGGLQRLSLSDFPGRIAAIVFTRGCNFRCAYCHNPELVDPARYADVIPQEEILRYLSVRRDMLQGVVVSGGEPTLQDDLPGFLQAARGLGTLGSPASVAPLRRALADDSWWGCFYAAVALAEHGERGQAALQDAQADPEPVVRDMARYLLERGPMIPALP